MHCCWVVLLASAGGSLRAMHGKLGSKVERAREKTQKRIRRKCIVYFVVVNQL